LNRQTAKYAKETAKEIALLPCFKISCLGALGVLGGFSDLAFLSEWGGGMV